MFTGLVETVGTIWGGRTRGDVFLLEIGAPSMVSGLRRGESVAVAGACLTVVAIGHQSFTVEIMPETLGCTRLSRMKSGERVNLERALIFGGRLDGHLVTGHVDGMGTVRAFPGLGQQTRKLTIEGSPALMRGIVSKGSVALDGVSLTVATVEGSSFCVGLIPTTLEDTTLGDLVEGSMVHVETDLLGKYVERFLTMQGAAVAREHDGGITWEKLRDYGWTS